MQTDFRGADSDPQLVGGLIRIQILDIAQQNNLAGFMGLSADGIKQGCPHLGAFSEVRLAQQRIRRFDAASGVIKNRHQTIQRHFDLAAALAAAHERRVDYDPM